MDRPAPQRQRSERGFDRLVNFSDAVVAIAISLLILPVVDDVSTESGLSASELMSENGDRLLVFVLSFVVIARFWQVHHQVFEWVTSYTNTIIAANLLWLLSIVFLPLPTELLGVRGPADAFVRFVYVGSMLVTSASMVLIELLVLRDPQIWRDGVRPQIAQGVLTLALFAVALVVAVAVEPIGLWALSIVFLGGPIGARFEKAPDPTG